MPASSRLSRAFSLVSSRTSPTVFSSGRPSTVLRLLAGSASMARIGPAPSAQAADEQAGQGRLARAAFAGDGDGHGHPVSLRSLRRPAGAGSAAASRGRSGRLEVGVGQEERRRVLVHEAVVGAEFEVGHLARPRRRPRGGRSRRGAPCTRPGRGVAEEVEALDRLVGQQPDADRLLDVDVLAEGAADEDLLHVGEVDADAGAEHLEAGVDRRLGADQVRRCRTR